MSSINNVINNAGGNYTFISSSTVVVASGTSIQFTNLSNAYDYYEFVLSRLDGNMSNTVLELRISTNNGSSFISSGSYAYSGLAANPTSITTWGGNNATSIHISEIFNDITTGIVKMYGAGISTQPTFISNTFTTFSNSSTFEFISNTGTYTANSIVNAVEFIPSQSTFGGTIYLYGVTI